MKEDDKTVQIEQISLRCVMLRPFDWMGDGTKELGEPALALLVGVSHRLKKKESGFKSGPCQSLQRTF